LWRINPDSKDRQVIASSYRTVDSFSQYIERPVRILNADWYLRVAPAPAWHSHPENFVLLVAALLISGLVALVTQKSCELRRMLVIDALTGIYNRRYFMEASQLCMKRSQRLSEDDFVMIFDIDHFKNVNDTYGHSVGDAALVEAACRVRTSLRPYDLFARYGGEEFIIYVSDMSLEDVSVLAERLRSSLASKEFQYDNITFPVTASFGIAKVDYDQDILLAINRADKAMYMAKKGGRNQVIIAQD
jgi:diguanylate cyclase (GGDEF)-like protein